MREREAFVKEEQEEEEEEEQKRDGRAGCLCNGARSIRSRILPPVLSSRLFPLSLSLPFHRWARAFTFARKLLLLKWIVQAWDGHLVGRNPWLAGSRPELSAFAQSAHAIGLVGLD